MFPIPMLMLEPDVSQYSGTSNTVDTLGPAIFVLNREVSTIKGSKCISTMAKCVFGSLKYVLNREVFWNICTSFTYHSIAL